MVTGAGWMSASTSSGNKTSMFLHEHPIHHRPHHPSRQASHQASSERCASHQASNQAWPERPPNPE